MGELWDGITGFFSNIYEFVRNYQISAIVNRMQVVKCRNALDHVFALAPQWLKMEQGVKDFYDMRYKEFTDSGMITIADAAKGPGIDYVKAFIKEFEGLYDNINNALGGTISKFYRTFFTTFTGKKLSKDAERKLSGTNIPEAIDGMLDSIIDMAMEPFLEAAPELDRAMDDKTKATIRESLKMSAGLGATIGLGGYIMEHWHPTKGTNAARSLNMMMDLIGYKTLSGIARRPLLHAAIEVPLEQKWNKIFQSDMPTQGEITGLARKYEITKDEYRDAMARQNVAPKWIDALLTGFWADPRLFEIIRLMEVERPSTTVPKAASDWLTRAQLSKYIGDDWWLAMKFAKAGYDEIDIPILVSAVKARNLQRELGDIRMLNRNQYKRGAYTREEYQKLLLVRGISAAESKELVDAMDEEIILKENLEFQRAYERKYLFGRITKDELEEKLKGLKLKEGRIAARLEYLLTMKEGKLAGDGDEKSLTVARIVNAYKYGQKEKTWAHAEVDKLGYTSEDASLLVESVDQKIKNDTIKQWQNTYEARTLSYRMTSEELKGKLIELGKDESWAEARAAYIEERRLGKEGPAEEEEEEEEEAPEE